MLTERHKRYLADTVASLGMELVAAKVNGSAPVMLEGGQRLDADPLGATYRFSLIYDSALPEGIPVQLEVAGQRWEAEVLQREGIVVLLLVKRHERLGLPEPTLPSALLHADPWYLIEALQTTVQQISTSPSTTKPTIKLLDLLCGSSAAVGTPLQGSPPTGLNAEQAAAVQDCTHQGVWFVWGPPGTGKTTTLGRVVEAAGSGESLLVTAHSNVAVDAALVAAHRSGVGVAAKPVVVRAGPAVLPEARATGLSTRELAFRQRPDLERAIADIVKQLAASRESVTQLVERWRTLMAELKQLEDDILKTASIVFATLSKATVAEAISSRRFDVGIVDEVSMSYPAQVLMTASLVTSRLNVFGDCRQLPPIVQSEAPQAQQFLGRDVFTACGVDQPNANGVTMLKEQFRMHPSIRKVVSDFAYNGQLRDADGVLAAREPVAANSPFEGSAVCWVDVGPLGATRFFDLHRGSRFNPVSALVALRLAIEARRSAERVVLLTPYRTQARLLAALVGDAELDHVEIGTIHRYQGSEAPVVVLDLVDSSGRKVGKPFEGAAGERLLTVGLSRAQGKLLVVGNARMATSGLSTRSVRALAAVQDQRRTAPPRPHLEVGPTGFELRCTLDAVDAEAVAAGEVVAAWLAPDDRALRRALGAVGDTWDGGHSVWFTQSGSMTLLSGTGSSRTGFTLNRAARFAEALSDAITGAPLSRRAALREVGDAAPPRVSRFDTCGRCGSPAMPVQATRYSVELECTDCLSTRRASEQDIRSWLREVGPRCPQCRGALNLISGRRAPYGPFFGCASYPSCDGMQPLDALVDAAIHPDPPPVTEGKAKSVRKSAAVSALDRRMCDVCFLSKATSLFDPGSTICRDCS